MSVIHNPRAPLDVLIAEDDCDTRLAVRLLLEEEGYSCAEAEDGRVAVEAAHQCFPRLVLMDLMMPEVDGFAAAKQLRSDPRTRGVRIHCLTALNFPAARRAAEEAGCDGFLTKPFTAEELLDAVSTAVYSLRLADDVLVRAVERLGQTLAAEVPGRESQWCKQLIGALSQLEAALCRQADRMDGDDGWLADADRSGPTLARRVAEFRQQHDNLVEQTRSLRAQVKRAAQAFRSRGDTGARADTMPRFPSVGPVVDFIALRRSGDRLVDAVRRHTEQERSVLFDSLNTDIGVGD
jgi:CheY-like chemotaxis protein